MTHLDAWLNFVLALAALVVPEVWAVKAVQVVTVVVQDLGPASVSLCGPFAIAPVDLLAPICRHYSDLPGVTPALNLKTG